MTAKASTVACFLEKCRRNTVSVTTPKVLGGG